MWIFGVNTVFQIYPKFPIWKWSFESKVESGGGGGGGGWGAQLKPRGHLWIISWLYISADSFTTFSFLSKFYIIFPSTGKTYSIHVIGKGVCRTNTTRIVANCDKMIRENTNRAGTEIENQIHEKSTPPGSVRRSPIQVLTGLAQLNFIEKRELFVSTGYGQTCGSVQNKHFINLIICIWLPPWGAGLLFPHYYPSELLL